MRDILPLIPGPSRHLGAEFGASLKDPAHIKARLALAFPDLYEVGMSYLGQKILYSLVNARPDLWAERVFAPSEDVAEIMREHDAPLSTMESDTPLADMDAVAFHLTHELCYTNVLYMLDLAGLPLESADRGPEHPLVMAGGGCTFNAEPLAPFLDLMVLGDGEEALPRIMEEIARTKGQGLSRDEILETLSAIPGVYVPSFFIDQGPGRPPRHLGKGPACIEKSIVADLSGTPFPTTQAVPFADTVHDRFAVEIARGCTRGCRFCQAGMIYRPVRERTPEELEDLVRRGLAATGFEDLSFLSLSTGDYSALEALFERSFASCRAEQISISLPSLRVGSVSDTVMKLMSSIRRTGATLAPEAGSQRLRDVINKGIEEQALLDHATALFAHGWQQVKLYFMIGLPTETKEDLDAILELCRKVQACAGPKVKRLQVTAAISPFVPKPHTPFQWEPQLTLDEVRQRVGYLRDIFRPHKKLKMRWHMPEMSWLEGVFSRGDRSLAPAVAAAYEKGALFTSWTDHLDLEPWREAFAETGVDADSFLAARDTDAPLPWDHLGCGVNKRYLLVERKRAVQGKLSPDCRFGTCRNCGVCNFGGRTSELSVQAEIKDIRPKVVLTSRDQKAPDPNTAPDAPVQNKPPDIGALSDKAAHLRIWHFKTGDARYLSGVETQRAIERAMRRARLPISFSAGFHPLPRMSFGRALTVGVDSSSEWFNIFLRRDMSPDDAAAALAPHMPPGMEIIKAENLTMGRKQAHSQAEDFDLVLKDPKRDLDSALKAWETAMDSDCLPWTRQTKKGEKTTDIRPLLAQARAAGTDRLALRLDWRQVYYNPLSLVRTVMPNVPMDRFLLVKTAQHMEFPREG